ncbi:MAG: hypothetical protein JNJ89_03760 [Rubrivivax sp.]|nr:hypothetical protein [Rubrivivax sp.]
MLLPWARRRGAEVARPADASRAAIAAPQGVGTAAATRVGPEVTHEFALRGAQQVLADGGGP